LTSLLIYIGNLCQVC
jgi:antitoxin ParD1/3/4